MPHDLDHILSGQHVPHSVNVSAVHHGFRSSLGQHVEQNLHLQLQQVVLHSQGVHLRLEFSIAELTVDHCLPLLWS